jgi:hypothetical protein
MGDFWRRYLALRKPTRFVDGMCGMGNVAIFVAGLELPDLEVVASDAHPALGTLLRAVAGQDPRWPEGWTPPQELSEARYKELRTWAKETAQVCPACQAQAGKPPIGLVHTCAASLDPEIGFAGFGVSFGGKYMAGYGGRPRPRYMRPVEGAAKAIVEKRASYKRVRWLTGDYRNLPETLGVRGGDTWYFDKPYTGTEQYKGVPANGCACGRCAKAKGAPVFCDTVFWRLCSELADSAMDAGRSTDVLVSDFVAPAPWSPVWQVTRRQEMRDGLNSDGSENARPDCVFALPNLAGLFAPLRAAKLTIEVQP